MTTRSTFAAVSRRAASAIFLIALACAARAELRVVADFEGGNAEVVKIDQGTRTLRIMPALHEGRGWPCWWYFRINGITSGETITLRLKGSTSVVDKPGALAKICAIFAAANISISSVFQPEGHEGESVPLILMIHDAPNVAMRRALA